MTGQTNHWLETTNYIKKCFDEEDDLSKIEMFLKSDANALKQLASTDSGIGQAVKKDLAVKESEWDNKWTEFITLKNPKVDDFRAKIKSIKNLALKLVLQFNQSMATCHGNPWFETTALIKKCIEEDKFIVMKKILLLSYAELKKAASNDTDSLGRAVKADLTMISSTFGWTTEEYLKTKWTEFINLMTPKLDEWENAIESFKTSSIKSIVTFQKNNDNDGTEVKGTGCSKQEIELLNSSIRELLQKLPKDSQK